MTNRLAIILALLIVAALCLDALLGARIAIFLARRLIDLIEWMAFWR